MFYTRILLLLLLNGIGYLNPDALIPSSTGKRMVQPNHVPNFRKVNDSVFRSGQPDLQGLEMLCDLPVHSILNLRRENDDTKFKCSTPPKVYFIPMDPENIQDIQIIQSLKIIRNAKKPLLIHCACGCDRTGVVIAMYRILFDQWSREDAITEMYDAGYNQKYRNIEEYIRYVDLNRIRRKVFEN